MKYLGFHGKRIRHSDLVVQNLPVKDNKLHSPRLEVKTELPEMFPPLAFWENTFSTIKHTTYPTEILLHFSWYMYLSNYIYIKCSISAAFIKVLLNTVQVLHLFLQKYLMCRCLLLSNLKYCNLEKTTLMKSLHLKSIYSLLIVFLFHIESWYG